jgi:hypothetical protein
MEIILVIIFFLVLALFVVAGITVTPPDSGWENRKRKK